MYIGELSALCSTVLWAFSSYIYSKAISKVGSYVVNFSRLVISWIFILLTVIIFQLPVNLTGNQYFLLISSGIIGLFIGDTFFFKSLEYLSPRISLLITSFVPAVAGVLAYFILGESLSILNIAGIIITLAGISFVVFKKEENSGKAKTWREIKIGLILSFLYTFGQAFGLILTKMAYREGDINSIVANLIRMIPAIICLWIFLLFIRQFKNPVKIFKADTTIFKQVLFASFFGSYLGLIFMLISIVKTDVAIASTIMATLPVIQLPIAHYIYKDNVTIRAITGAAISVAGIIILFLKY